MLPIALTLLFACGEKTEDTANTLSSEDTTDSEVTEGNDGEETGEDTDTTDGTDTDTTGDTDNGDNGGDNIEPNGGAWTVFGPEFTTNTCGGGEEFPESRSMTLGLNGNILTMFIEETGEYDYTFTCTLSDSEFVCEDIVIENNIPVLPCTLTYTHKLQGIFMDSNTLEGEYTIITTSSGGSGCSESSLGFTTPCEQVGTMTGTFGQ